MRKKDVKNAVDLLTGKMARTLNEKYMLFAGAAEPGYAKLCFKGDGMKHYEDASKPVSNITPTNGSLIPEGVDLKDFDLPNQVLKNYKHAQEAKSELEALGISDIQIGYSNAATVSKDGGPFERVHEIFIVFPIDAKHRRNHLVARSMAKRDRAGVNFYKPVLKAR